MNSRTGLSRTTAQSGFTLIELLVVISIIVLLIAILLPALGMARKSARNAQCLSNVHQHAVALTAYHTDHSGTLPTRYVRTSNDPNVFGTSLYLTHGKGDSTRRGDWGADVRPMNPYLVSNTPGRDDQVPVAKCPSDVGTNNHSSGNIPYYDSFGMSYPLSMHTGLEDLSDPGINNGQGGMSVNQIRNPGKLVAVAEHDALSVAWSTTIPLGFDESGWHLKDDSTFNVGFADSSAGQITFDQGVGQLQGDDFTFHEDRP